MKKFYAAVFLVILVIALLLINIDKLRLLVRKHLAAPYKVFIKELILGKEYIKEISYLKKSNYNQKIFPNTEFEKILFTKIKIKSLKNSKVNHYNKIQDKISPKKKFFISLYKENVYMLDSQGTIILINDLASFEENIINSNINELKIHDLKDSHIDGDNIFVSYSAAYNKDCYGMKIAKANLLEKKLNFKIFFKTDKCLKNLVAGKMASYNYNNKSGLLISTGDDGFEKENYAQSDKSIFGKIIFIDFQNKNPIVISKGHRNPQGLFVFSEKIFSTEHGPKGGDEINLIKKNENYGWPISSYGEPYSFISSTREEYKYKKEHEDMGFTEPIYSFVPSIGISQIIKIPNNFSKYWKDNFFVTSLNGASIYRIKFDKKFTKLIYSEKIIVGERIRDIEFSHKHNKFILALEDSGSIGILSVYKNDQ